MELESIGRNICKFRLMRNLRQEDLAEMAGLSINYVGALERGEKIPSLETFIVSEHPHSTRFGAVSVFDTAPSVPDGRFLLPVQTLSA